MSIVGTPEVIIMAVRILIPFNAPPNSINGFGTKAILDVLTFNDHVESAEYYFEEGESIASKIKVELTQPMPAEGAHLLGRRLASILTAIAEDYPAPLELPTTTN